MLGKEATALHQCHGMGVNLVDGIPVVVGQTADAVAYVQLVLAHYRGARVAQQLVVMQQTAGNGVLYGGHADDGGVVVNLGIHLFECSAADELHLLALEIQMGCHIVERTGLTLDGYSLHTVLILNTNPASIEAGK